MKVLSTSIKTFYVRFLKIRGTPEQISKGVALGLFVGMTPLMGFHTNAAVALASVFGWNKIAAGLGVFITNPFTAPIIYSFTYHLGSKITGYSEPAKLVSLYTDDGFIALIKSFHMIIADLSVGGLIVGIPAAIAGYYATFKIVTGARKKMKKTGVKKTVEC